MRSLLAACTIIASTLSASLALANPTVTSSPPPTPVVVAPHAPTPINADKIVRPASKSVSTIPVVTEHTANLAAQHETIKSNPARPLPAKVRLANDAVLTRNEEIGQTRVSVRTEATSLESQAHAMANPTRVIPGAYSGHRGAWVSEHTESLTPTTEQLAQSSETYVAAAQVAVKKGGNFNARVARDNPDAPAKVEASKEMASDYRRGAELYRKSADIELKRADALEAAGKKPEAGLARDKAHNTRFVADRLERDATEIETKGVPGANPKPAPEPRVIRIKHEGPASASPSESPAEAPAALEDKGASTQADPAASPSNAATAPSTASRGPRTRLPEGWRPWNQNPGGDGKNYSFTR